MLRSPSPTPPGAMLSSPAVTLLREDEEPGLLGGTANSLLLGGSSSAAADDDEPSPPARSSEDRELPPLAASPGRVASIRRRLEGVVSSAATSGPNSGTTSRGTGSTPAAAGVRDGPSRSDSPMVPVGASEESPQALRRGAAQAASAVSFEADDGAETDDGGDGAATEHGRPRRTRSVSYVEEDRLPPHPARSIDGAAGLTSLVGQSFELTDWGAEEADVTGNSGTFGRAALSEALESAQPSPMSRHGNRRFASASRASEGLGLSLSGQSQLASLLSTPHASFASPSLGPHGLPPLNTTGQGNSACSSQVASPDSHARANSLGHFFHAGPPAAANLASDAGSPRNDPTRPPCLELCFTPQQRGARPDGAHPPPLASALGISGDIGGTSRQSTCDVEGPFFVGRGFRSAGPPTPNGVGNRSTSPGATSPIADMSHRSQRARRSPSVGEPARSPAGHRSHAASPTSRLPPAGPPTSRRRAGTYTTGQGGGAEGGSPSVRPVLVLDLDKTLVSTDWVDGVCGQGDFCITYEKRKVAVDMRPRLCSFLQRMAVHYRLVVFTATDAKYGKPIVRQIESRADVKFEKLFFKDSCERRDVSSTGRGAAGDEQDNAQPFVDTPSDAAATRGPRAFFVKNLSVLGVPLSRVLLMDDKSASFSDQPRNGIRIAPYRRPDTSDQELDAMATLLEKVAASAFRDVRDALESVRRAAAPPPLSPPGGALRSVASFGTYSRPAAAGAGAAGDSPGAFQQHHAHSSGSLFARTAFSRSRQRSLSMRSDTESEVAEHAPNGSIANFHASAATVVPPTALHPVRPSSANGGSSAAFATGAGLNATYPASSTTPVPSAGPLNLSFGTVNNMSFDWPHSQQQPHATATGSGPVSPSQRPSPLHRAPAPRLSYNEYEQ
jgi:RNA polymerase II subunit A small phosphatase-like protein